MSRKKKAKMPVAEREWMRAPVSKVACFRIFVTGEFGNDESAKMLRLITAQYNVLTEDEAAP